MDSLKEISVIALAVQCNLLQRDGFFILFTCTMDQSVVKQGEGEVRFMQVKSDYLLALLPNI